ncbi:MAG TPA: hypothetical protein VGK67_11235 [Myxococcales bacterium]|jgi:hypothetical protein
MKKILVTFLLGFACCAGLFATLSYHFIRVSSQTLPLVEKKSELSFKDTFVDTRGWGIGDWFKNPRIGALVAKNGIKSAFDTDAASKDAKEAVEKSKKAIDDGLEKVQEGLRK